ncbi:SPOR domain-containing protein [Devosia chinhatensis]|uniref:SPOR domain-containing protein n=1 Tax=Devosia chinhatensis TaxID=429727 RepID=A0A0F5FKL9_9HYPH|nr:SPOR domain-containing protein [Devosia chinhatensis]KKB09444.1 hypothetical protein VE26_05830 [Devosia chinhatensis]
MAAQSDAQDDLIAELARLMADDARSDQAPRPQRPPEAEKAPLIRIPGGDAPSVQSTGINKIRIPGAANAAEPGPFNFDFGVAPKRPAPAQVEPSFAREEPKPSAAAPVPADDGLDHDGLADLIAAELANELTAEPAPPTTSRTEDNFGTPPVFGLGAPPPTPSPAPELPQQPAPVAIQPAAPVVPVQHDPVAEVQPVSEPLIETPVEPQLRDTPPSSDALRDIEQLIAPVVQKAQKDAETNRAPSPALRSLATPTLPVVGKTEPVRPRKSSEVGSVDDAILAAAAASGARVEWVNPEIDQQDVETAEVPVAPRRRGFRLSRSVAGPLVAVSLLGIAGFGLYWLLGQGGAPSGPAPLLVADTTPVKDVPEPTEPTTQQSVVFNEISGANNPADEQLVPRDQADQAALDEAVSGTSAGNVISSGDTGGVDPNQEGLVNRKVRTVTVRPDGTIISGTSGMAGSAILPVERPNVPEVPGATSTAPDLIADTIAATEDAAATAALPAAEATPTPAATPATTPVTPGSVVPVVDATGAAISGRTVTIPSTRPADFAQTAAGALAASSVPATPPAQAATTTPAAATPISDTTSGAAAYVQLASQRSEDAARQSAQAMNTRYGVLFAGVAPEIQRVDLGERGIYYRVLVGAPSREAAANICTNIRAAGGDCLLP